MPSKHARMHPGARERADSGCYCRSGEAVGTPACMRQGQEEILKHAVSDVAGMLTRMNLTISKVTKREMGTR